MSNATVESIHRLHASAITAIGLDDARTAIENIRSASALLPIVDAALDDAFVQSKDANRRMDEMTKEYGELLKNRAH